MKTNLANLMSIVSEEEKKLSNYGFTLRSYAYNTSIQEAIVENTVLRKIKNIYAN